MPKLNTSDAAYLTVEIKGKSYNIPLAQSLKVKELRKFMKLKTLSEEEQFDAMITFFEQYIPEEVVEDLYEAQVEDLFNMWTKANEEVGGLKTGES